ncbi:MAG: hypothetical protein K6T31_03495, partial [Alicyclobacillus sp.]|nr:hypothetical protein [Alicyclobacillus sp.]
MIDRQPQTQPDSAHQRRREKLFTGLRDLVRILHQANRQEEQVANLLQAASALFQCDETLLYLASPHGSGDTRQPRLQPYRLRRGQAPSAATLADTSQSPLDLARCSRRILTYPYRWPSDDREPALLRCALFTAMEQRGYSTWFSLPLITHGWVIGFIVAGYYHYHYLIDDAGHVLSEFAQDVASALARHQEHWTGVRADVPPAPLTAEDLAYPRARKLLANHYELSNTLWSESDADLHHLTERISRMLQQPAAVLDAFHSVLSVYPDNASWRKHLDPCILWLEQHDPFRHGLASLPMRVSPGGDETVVVTPIRTGTTLHGCLVIGEQERPLDDLDLISVQEAMMVLAVYFFKRGMHIQRRGRGFQELLNVLLDQPEAWRHVHTAEARRLGWDPFSPQCVMVALLRAPGSADTPIQPGYLGLMVDELRQHLEALYPHVFVARREEALVFLVPDSLTAAPTLEPFLEVVRGTLGQRPPGLALNGQCRAQPGQSRDALT